MVRSRFLAILSLILASLFIALNLFYLLIPEYIDHVEPLIASVSWLSMKGLPLYHSLDSAERYSNLYGPYLYLFTGSFLKELGPSLLTSKMGATFANFLTLIVLTFTLPKERRSESWVLALGLFSLYALSFFAAPLWIRAEPWLVLTSAMALFTAIRFPKIVSSIVLGVLISILVNLKIHAAIYALPAVAIVFKRERILGLFITGAAFLACVALPFLLIPNLSFIHLLEWIKVTSAHGFSATDFAKNLEWAAFLFLASVGIRKLFIDEHPDKIFSLALMVGLALACFTGCLRGAGKYHLLPFVPSLIMFIFQAGVPILNTTAKQKKIALAFLAALIPLALAMERNTLNFVGELNRKQGEAKVADLQSLIDRHPNESLQMSYGFNYNDTFYHPLVVFREGKSLLEAATLMDMKLVNLEVTPATLEKIKQCEPKLWIFPKGDTPFDLRHVGDQNLKIFNPEVSEIFLAHYQKTQSSDYFDLWECQK